MWSLSSSPNCRFTRSLITLWALLQQKIFPQSVTVYFTSFTKSTPYGDVAFQVCTRVELLYLEVETAAVQIYDQTAFDLFGHKCQALKRREVCECVCVCGHDWISLIHLVLFWELCIFDLLRESVVFLIQLVQRDMCRQETHSTLTVAMIVISVFLWSQYLVPVGNLHNNWPHCELLY